MRIMSRMAILLSGCIAMASANAEVTFTYLDFEYLQQAIDTTGFQGTPAPGQTVDVLTDEGDGISVSGSVAVGERFVRLHAWRVLSRVGTDPLHHQHRGKQVTDLLG